MKQVLDLGIPAMLGANLHFHRLLVGGVPVQYPLNGETRGDLVRLMDWAEPLKNDWLAVNQFSIKGPHHTRRPDIIQFVNGLPLVLIELKNPADLNADVWKAVDQIQTYKEQIPDIFLTNEVLVISDGTEALLGSLSADAERFMAWRTIDGITLDPLGEFNELQTLVRGVMMPHRAEFAPPAYVVDADAGSTRPPTSTYQVGYAQNLRDALPHATFVAFTGTPVSSTDRDTRAVFGDYIHVHDMQQAQVMGESWGE